jgi:hypothetical protein
MPLARQKIAVQLAANSVFQEIKLVVLRTVDSSGVEEIIEELS